MRITGTTSHLNPAHTKGTIRNFLKYLIRDTIPETRPNNKEMTKAKLSDEQWREKLTPEQYNICRCSATEPPFTGKYAHCKDDGVYHCSCCGQALFDSSTKYDSLMRLN
jgi:hypothetical protein